MTYFQTKLHPEDFIVTEILAKEPSGTWDFHYILFQKKWLTTFLFLDLMMKEFGLNRNSIGIAGLKDKNAITRQRISISKRDAFKECGGINNLLAWIRKKGKVISATYGDHMLKVGENIGNHFDLVLVPNADTVDTRWHENTKHWDKTKKPNPTKKPQTAAEKLFFHWDRNDEDTIQFKEKIAHILDQIEKKGLPNYFGEQRFWRFGSNRKVGFDLLSGAIRNITWDKNTLVEKRFKVQAFSSYVFNEYLKEREKKWLLYTRIPWDILWKDKKTVTGPVPWDDLALAGQDAGTLEKEVFSKVGLSQQIMNRFKTFGLFWIRRPILMYPTNIKHTWRGKLLMLSFDLPAGAYATTLIESLEKELCK